MWKRGAGTRATRRQSSENPSSKSDKLCENLRALAHPGKLPGWSYKPREPPQFRGVDEPALLRHHAAILAEIPPPLATKSDLIKVASFSVATRRLAVRDSWLDRARPPKAVPLWGVTRDHKPK